MADRWVDFFISGVQKGGTTALYSKLKDHPEINLSTRKELHFFDDEQVDWQSPDYAKLHAFRIRKGRSVWGGHTYLHILARFDPVNP
jgi:hypothetical protein